MKGEMIMSSPVNETQPAEQGIQTEWQGILEFLMELQTFTPLNMQEPALGWGGGGGGSRQR